MKPKDKLFETWAAQLLASSPQTARGYVAGLRRLLDLLKVDSKTLLGRAKRNPKTAWIWMKRIAEEGFPKKSVSITALYAARHFLLSHDQYMALPPAKLKIKKMKPPVYLKWDDANRIADAAGSPYNMIFRIMVQTGWGIGEFLKFNTPETWRRAKAKLAGDPTAEFFRFDFSGRKRNNRPFYSLVPMKTLRECVALEARKGLSLPICGRGRNGTPGTPLDHVHLFSARTYIESAFRTALKRAPVTDVQGTPGAHELRDVFFTRAVQVGCAESAANFVMGHMIDKLGYNKACNNEAWVWSEIKKVHGPAVVTEDKLKKITVDLERVRAKVERGDSKQTILEAVAEFKEKLMSEFLGKSEGGKVSFLTLPPELAEVTEIEKILKDPNAGPLDKWKAEKRFERLVM